MQLHAQNVLTRLTQGRKSNDGAWRKGARTPLTGHDADGNPIGGEEVARPEGEWQWLPVGSRRTLKDGKPVQNDKDKHEWESGFGVDRNQTKYNPTEYIYGPYSINDEFQDIYENVDVVQPTKQKEDGTKETRIFRGVDRIKLMMDIIAAKEQDGGAELSFATMKNEKALTAFFPIHDYEELWQLERAWIKTAQVGAVRTLTINVARSSPPAPTTPPAPIMYILRRRSLPPSHI